MLNVRGDFPYLDRRVHGRPLVYLDSAATTQKPRSVIERVVARYTNGIANVHRAVSFLAEEVTDEYESSRETVARFLGCDAREVVFALNATHGINLVCDGLASKGDLRVITTTLEHHANLLPWIARATVELTPWTTSDGVDLEGLRNRLSTAETARNTLVTLSTASNFTGTWNRVEEAVRICHEHQALTLVDASQSVAHERVDVSTTGCDFLVFSGHKVYGPSGVGVLFGRGSHLESLQPMVLGGHMVKEVHIDRMVLNDIPHRFEAGTPNIEGVIGLGAALEYIESLGFDAIAAHEHALVQETKERLSRLASVRMYGPAPGQPSAPLVAFDVQGLESVAVAKLLAGRANVIVRSGFHCAQPAHDELHARPTVRASFGVYNDMHDVDVLCDTLVMLSAAIAI